MSYFHCIFEKRRRIIWAKIQKPTILSQLVLQETKKFGTQVKKVYQHNRGFMRDVAPQKYCNVHCSTVLYVYTANK